MKFEFVATVILQVRGEAEGTADDLSVISNPEVLITPTVIAMPSEPITELDEETRTTLMGQLAHHCVNRAEIMMRPADGFTHSEPIPISDPKDPNKRN